MISDGRRPRWRTILLLLVCLFLAFEGVLGKKGARRRRRKKGQQFRDFRYIVTGFFILLIAPVLISFLNALRRDPAVPQLIAVTITAARERFFSFLGKKAPSRLGSKEEGRGSGSAGTSIIGPTTSNGMFRPLFHRRS